MAVGRAVQLAGDAALQRRKSPPNARVPGLAHFQCIPAIAAARRLDDLSNHLKGVSVQPPHLAASR